MQNNIVAASQRHMATVLDKRVEAAQLKDREKKEFKEGELVLSFRQLKDQKEGASALRMLFLLWLREWMRGSISLKLSLLIVLKVPRRRIELIITFW
jgi:hypothetical protein